MKNILNLILVLTFGVLLFTSCDQEPDLRKPETPIQFAAYLKTTTTSDFKVDLTDLNGMNIEFIVDGLYPDDPFQKLTLVVVRNNDYKNQFVVQDNITSVPTTVQIGINEFIAAIPDLNSTDDIQEGDLYNFFLNVTLEDGTVLPGYLDNGQITYSPSMRNILLGLEGAAFNASFFTPCILDMDAFTGNYMVSEDGGDPYPVTVERDPDNEYGLVINGLWWDETTKTEVVIDPDYYTISAENQMIWPGNAYGAYGTIWLEDFTEGFANTCTLGFEFVATPTLPDTGLWWGVSPLFKFTPAGKTDAENKTKPAEDNLIKR